MKFFLYIAKILIIVDLIFFISCNQTTTKQDILLKEAELLAEEDPLKAFSVLDSIVNPSISLSKENYMKYLVINTQIKSKNGQNIENDTLIEDAISFYQKHKDNKQLGKAYFYAGNVYTMRDDRERAFKYFLKALDLSTSSGEMLFEGRSLYNLGYHYYYNNIKDTAGIYWKKSLKIFQKLEQKQNIGQNLYMLALIEYQNRNVDKSKKYADQSLFVAKEIGDRKTLFWTNNLLGILTRDEAKYNLANQFFQQALLNSITVEDSSKVYTNIADLYLRQAKLDTAINYIQLLEKQIILTDDLYTLRSMHLTMADYYKRLKDYKAVLYHGNIAERLDNLIEQKKITKTIYELDKQHTIDKFKQEEFHKKLRYLVVAIIIVLFLGLAYFYRHIKLKRKMNRLEDEINRITKQM